MISIVVLAAGMGERLRPVTETAPKPLIKISESDSIMSNNKKSFPIWMGFSDCIS